MAAEIALKSPLPPPLALTRLTPMRVKLPATAIGEDFNSRVTRKLSLQVLAQGSLVSVDNEQVLNCPSCAGHLQSLTPTCRGTEFSIAQ